MCRSGPGRPDGAVSRLCPTPRRGGASRTRKPRATVVGLGWPADAKGEPRSSRPRPSAPQPPATQPNIVGPPRRWVSAGSSPHLPLFIILREIQRELCLRGEGGSGKAKKIWGSGDREESEGVNMRLHASGLVPPYLCLVISPPCYRLCTLISHPLCNLCTSPASRFSLLSPTLLLS